METKKEEGEEKTIQEEGEEKTGQENSEEENIGDDKGEGEGGGGGGGHHRVRCAGGEGERTRDPLRDAGGGSSGLGGRGGGHLNSTLGFSFDYPLWRRSSLIFFYLSFPALSPLPFSFTISNWIITYSSYHLLLHLSHSLSPHPLLLLLFASTSVPYFYPSSYFSCHLERN